MKRSLTFLLLSAAAARADGFRQYLTLLTQVPSIEARAFSTAGVSTTTKQYNAGPQTITRTVAVDDPLPTVVYYCNAMDTICENTKRKITGNQVTWNYDGADKDTTGSTRRRNDVCSDVFTQACLAKYGCDTRYEIPQDWPTTCDEAPPAAFIEGGNGAAVMCASYRQQSLQGRLLAQVANLYAGDGMKYATDGRLHPVVVSLDYSAHASSEYGKVLAGGATLNKNNAKASTTITGRAPGKTTTSGAYTYTTREYVGNNQYASCSASSSSSDGCSNGNVARSLQTAAVANTGEGATSRPTVTLPPPRLQRYDQRDNLQPRATASCSRKSDKDRSKDKARTARRAVDSAKDLIDGFDDAEDIAQAIKDAARLGLAGALAAAAAADLLSDDDDSSGNRDDVYADASSALSAAAPMRTYSDSDVQEAYTDLSVAATEASSAADIASTYLPSKPTATTTSTTAKPTTAPTTTTTTAKPSTQTTSKAATTSTSTAPQPTYAPPSGGCYGEGDKARVKVKSLNAWLGYSSTNDPKKLDRYSLLHLHEAGQGTNYLAGAISPGHPWGLFQAACPGVEGLFGISNDNQNPVWNPLCSGDQELRAYFNTRRAHTILAKGSKGFAPLFLFGDRASQIDKVYPCINKDTVGDDFKIISDELIFDHAYQTQTRRGLNDTLDDGIFEGIEGLVNVASPLVGQDIFLHPL